MQAIGKFVRRPPVERRLILRAGVLVGGMRVGLTLLPFRWVRAAVGRVGRTSPSPPRSPRRPEELARAVTAVSRFVPRATCLTQALALQVLLAREGHRSDLQIGVAKADGRLEAHAWVENEGRILIGEHGSRFTPLAAPDRAGTSQAG